MPSTALRNLIQPFIASKASKNYVPREALLAIGAARHLGHGSAQSKNIAFQYNRRDASTSAESTPYKKHADGFIYGPSGLPASLEAVVSSGRPQGAPAWITVIDQYLPYQLRDGAHGLLEERHSSQTLQPIISLPQLLSRARVQSELDILSYLGVHQGRWEAVLWLVKSMMDNHTDHATSDKGSKKLLGLWQYDGKRLDVVTEKPLQISFPQTSMLSLDFLTDNGDDSRGKRFTMSGYQSLGEVWQSLGAMILQAADHSPDDHQYDNIMVQVFRILGHLFRLNAVPSTIYNYSPATDQTVLQRPPTLYLLSRRIMSTLSDVEFCLHWEKEVFKYQEMGFEISKTSVQPKIREFGPELWLDLVLWVCVEGGWTIEGAWIIRQINKRQGNRDQRWSAISWPEICARKEPQLHWLSMIRFQIDKTRLNQVGGLGIATGKDSTIDMGTRTISREVILAIIDGLLNVTQSRQRSYGTSPHQVQQNVSACIDLLECDHPDLDAKLLNSIILRLIENTDVSLRDAPGALQRILSFRRMLAKNGRIADANLPAQDAGTDDVAAILGLLHIILYGFAQGGNLQGSLTAFRKIQDVVDMERKESIQEFATELNVRIQEADSCDDLIEPHIDSSGENRVPPLSSQIPVSVLIAFLDLITNSKFFDVGKWLLHNDDVDGGVIGPKLYADRNLQSALLRFATATADDNLLSKVLEQIEIPLSQPILHALLRCQIVLCKWSDVEDIFQNFQRTSGLSWKASDAMAIASTILLLEHNPPSPKKAEDISQAQNILSKLVRGKYNSQQDPSELPDLSEAKMANQLGRIFRTLPDSLRNIVIEMPRVTNRAHTSISITPNAFNILLETVVECHGPLAGKRLWERWCHEPAESASRSSPTIEHLDGRARLPSLALEEDLEKERIVTPTLHMLRNILRPILKFRQRPKLARSDKSKENVSNPAPDEPGAEAWVGASALPEEVTLSDGRGSLTGPEQDILEWGISMYTKFGMTEREINIEVPGAFPCEPQGQRYL